MSAATQPDSARVPEDLQDLDSRDVSALTECMVVVDDHPDTPLDGQVGVVSGETTYVVDPVAGTCNCRDCLHRGVTCKHQRRIAFAHGERDIPQWVNRDRLDWMLRRQLDTMEGQR